MSDAADDDRALLSGERVTPTSAQLAVAERWRRKLGPKRFGEMLVQMQQPMASMEAQRRRREASAILHPNRESRIVGAMPNQQCVDFYMEMVAAAKIKDRE
jgi:hypothetical protein